MDANNFTFDYFQSEINQFRELCSNKAFMENEEKQDAAIKGLTFVYFNALSESKEQEERIKLTFKAAIDNYNIRKVFMAKLLIEKLARN